MKQFIFSIIITTKNEAENIGHCLESIKRQNFSSGKVEIIVVDNNSTDKTKQIARRFTKLVFNKGPERSAQRNYGMKKAKGKYLFYLDADMSLSAGLLKAAVEKMEKGNLAGLYIVERVMGEEKLNSTKTQKPEVSRLVHLGGGKYWTRVRDFERQFYTGTAVDAVRMVRADVFAKSGGFDEKLTGPEDWDFDKRIRQMGKTAVLPEHDGCIFHNEGRFSFAKYLHKKSYYLKYFARYKVKWLGDPEVKKQFSPWYRMFGVFLERGKWKGLLGRPDLAAGMYILRFMVAVGYVIENLKALKKKVV